MVGRRVTCYMFGPLGMAALYRELSDVHGFEIEAPAPGPEPFYCLDYGGFKCWYIPIGEYETEPIMGYREGFTWVLAGTVSDVR